MKRLEERGLIHISKDRHRARCALCISEAFAIISERHSVVVDRCSATALERLQLIKLEIALGRSSAYISFQHSVNIAQYRAIELQNHESLSAIAVSRIIRMFLEDLKDVYVEEERCSERFSKRSWTKKLRKQ